MKLKIAGSDSDLLIYFRGWNPGSSRNSGLSWDSTCISRYFRVSWFKSWVDSQWNSRKWLISGRHFIQSWQFQCHSRIRTRHDWWLVIRLISTCYQRIVKVLFRRGSIVQFVDFCWVWWAFYFCLLFSFGLDLLRIRCRLFRTCLRVEHLRRLTARHCLFCCRVKIYSTVDDGLCVNLCLVQWSIISSIMSNRTRIEQFLN